MEPKFVCKHCGLCCSRASLDVKHSKSGLNIVTEFPSLAKNGYVLFCSKPTLPLFDWEAEEVSELAKKNNSRISLVPYKAVYDKKSKTSIILQYTFKEKDCPFHSNNRCLIYRSRPLICRSFPATNGSFTELLTNNLHINVSGCPNDFNEEDWKKFCKENPRKLQFIKGLFERYDESYLARLESGRMLMDMDNVIKELISSGKIGVPSANIDPALLLRKIEDSKQVPLTEFLQESGHKDAETIRELIESISNLKWAKAMMKKWLHEA